jgi:O-antigen ligase
MVIGGIISGLIFQVETDSILIYLVLFLINALIFMTITGVDIDRKLYVQLLNAFDIGLIVNLIYIFSIPDGDRPSGFFDNPNGLAFSAGMSVMLNLYYLLFFSKKKWMKLSFILKIMVSFVLVNETASRAIIVMLLLFSVLLALMYLQKSRMKIISILVIVGIVSLGFYMADYVKLSAVERQETKKESIDEDIRVSLNKAGVEAFWDTGMLGLGSGQFKEPNNFIKYIKTVNKSLYKDYAKKEGGLGTHNTLIQVLSENGIIGFLIILMVLVGVFKQLRNAKEEQIKIQYKLNIFICMVVFSLVHVILKSPWYWFGLAMIITILPKDNRR